MKTTIVIVILSFSSMKLYAPYNHNKGNFNNSCVITNEDINNKELEKFLNHLGKKESGNKWNVVNFLGAKGAYQITDIALKDIGYKGSIKTFLKDSCIQKECVVQLLKKNKLYLKNYLHFIDKKVRGINITLAGLLSAAHLAGAGNVQKFFNFGYNAKDINDDSVVTRLREFSKYNLILN